MGILCFRSVAWEGWGFAVKFVKLLHRYGVLNPIGRIIVLIGAFVLFLNVVMWIGNPYLEGSESSDGAVASWTAPPVERPSTTVAPLPPGFPSMMYPPPMPEVGEGEPQPVPTKFGLTYTVPADWLATNSMVMGWSDKDGSIATYGAGSDYRSGYCDESDTSSMATVGVTGRNGIDIDRAAREEVEKAERLYADDEAGYKPKVEIRGPFSFEVSGRPAIRYTAEVSDIRQPDTCGLSRASFDVVATSGYSSAEFVLLVVMRHKDLPDALSDADVDAIIKSLRKTEE